MPASRRYSLGTTTVNRDSILSAPPDNFESSNSWSPSEETLLTNYQTPLRRRTQVNEARSSVGVGTQSNCPRIVGPMVDNRTTERGPSSTTTRNRRSLSQSLRHKLPALEDFGTNNAPCKDLASDTMHHKVSPIRCHSITLSDHESLCGSSKSSSGTCSCSNSRERRANGGQIISPLRASPKDTPEHNNNVTDNAPKVVTRKSSKTSSLLTTNKPPGDRLVSTNHTTGTTVKLDLVDLSPRLSPRVVSDDASTNEGLSTGSSSSTRANKEQPFTPFPPAANTTILSGAPPCVGRNGQHLTWVCSCGYELGMMMKFCGKCGNPRNWTCSDCHFNQNVCDFEFCGNCGTKKSQAKKTKKTKKTTNKQKKASYATTAHISPVSVADPLA